MCTGIFNFEEYGFSPIYKSDSFIVNIIVKRKREIDQRQILF